MTASTFNLAKNIIGGGMLALPAGMAAGRGTGYAPAFALMAATCVLSAYTFVLVGKSVDATGARSFKDLWAKTIGPKSAWAVDAAIFALCFGVCIMYGCFLGDLFSSLAGAVPAIPAALASRTSAIVGITAVVLLPLCLLRDLSALRFSSMAGIGAVLYVTGFVAKRALDGTYRAGTGRLLRGLDTTLLPRQATGGLMAMGAGTFVLFNMLSTAFMAHPNAVKFYTELKEATPRRFARVTYAAFALAALVYGTVMACGYATFGQASSGLILNNYHARDDILAVLGRLGTGISIIGSQPLLFAGLRESAFSTFTTMGLIPKDVDSRPALWAGLSAALLAAATAIAIVTPDVGVVVSLVGALLGAGMVYSLPSYLYMCVRRRRAGGGGGGAVLRMPALRLVFLFGIVMTLVGTGLTVLDMRK
ncbi:transmembrane amino acid transporter protein-domain-containing protein [Tribonema minus]|uniref:Transmembrane amino acid transporter protein-domain-containing protein n=1 Tax=Tribonema minus TaxID=303371 RepID=A0A835ZGQ0_9STRA|nr:transmembrane amino acid transporter protein-domain-containing protein [Tribonema minus]